jgi:hypothetical protein
LHEALGDIPPAEFEHDHAATIVSIGPIPGDGSIASTWPKPAEWLTTRRISPVTADSSRRLKSRLKGDLAKTAPTAAVVQTLATGLYDE